MWKFNVGMNQDGSDGRISSIVMRMSYKCMHVGMCSAFSCGQILYMQVYVADQPAGGFH